MSNQAAPKRPPTILFVDDDSNILEAMRRVLRRTGWKLLCADNTDDALELVEQQPVDVVVSDLRMPDMDGAELLKRIGKQHPSIMRILLTGYADMTGTIKAINQGHIYGFLSKPWDNEQLLVTLKNALRTKWLEDRRHYLERLTQKQNEQLKSFAGTLEARVKSKTEELRQTVMFLDEAHQELNDTYRKTVNVFAHLVELNEGRVTGYSKRVAEHCRKLALSLGMTEQESTQLYYAGMLHRIGMIGMDRRIFEKPYERLTSSERRQFRRYPQIGEMTLMGLEMLEPAAHYIRMHREYLNGSGFPDRLEGDAIPLGARILTVVTDYNSQLMGYFSYRQSEAETAKEQLLKSTGSRYDNTVVENYLELLEREDADKVTSLQLTTDELEPGMVLATDLLTEDEIMLLAKGSMLTSRTIERVRGLEREFEIEFKVAVVPPEAKEEPSEKGQLTPSLT